MFLGDDLGAKAPQTTPNTYITSEYNNSVINIQKPTYTDNIYIYILLYWEPGKKSQRTIYQVRIHKQSFRKQKENSSEYRAYNYWRL